MAQWDKNDNAANSPFWSSALSRKRETTANQSYEFSNNVFGVATGEQTAKRAAHEARPAHAGWVRKTEGTGGRAGRIHYETLVAMKSITGDAGDDATFADYLITIITQPQSSNQMTGNAISFTVSANAQPSGATLVYTWEVDGGVGTWTAISDGGLYANSGTATLNISNNATLAANVYRVIVQATGADNVISSNASVSIY